MSVADMVAAATEKLPVSVFEASDLGLEVESLTATGATMGNTPVEQCVSCQCCCACCTTYTPFR